MPACHGINLKPCHMSFARDLDRMPLRDADNHSIHGETGLNITVDGHKQQHVLCRHQNSSMNSGTIESAAR